MPSDSPAKAAYHRRRIQAYRPRRRNPGAPLMRTRMPDSVYLLICTRAGVGDSARTCVRDIRVFKAQSGTYAGRKDGEGTWPLRGPISPFMPPVHAARRPPLAPPARTAPSRPQPASALQAATRPTNKARCLVPTRLAKNMFWPSLVDERKMAGSSRGESLSTKISYCSSLVIYAARAHKEGPNALPAGVQRRGMGTATTRG